MAAIPQIETLMKRPDPLFAFKWACVNSTLPFGLPSDYVESIDMPFNNVKIGETLFSGGRYDNFAGSHSIGSVNLVLYEDQKGTCTKWIQLWKSMIKDMSTGFYKLPGDGTTASLGYKQQLDVALLDTKNSTIMTLELLGIWPESTSNWTLGYTEDGRLTVSQSFSIDDQRIKFT